jgi:hypothetical protein
MLALTSFCVQMHPSVAAFLRMYFWVHSVLKAGVLFLAEEELHGRTDRYGDQKSQSGGKSRQCWRWGGLYLWVKLAGGKLWRWSYRFEGKEKLMSLGKYADLPLPEPPQPARSISPCSRKEQLDCPYPLLPQQMSQHGQRIALSPQFHEKKQKRPYHRRHDEGTRLQHGLSRLLSQQRTSILRNLRRKDLHLTRTRCSHGFARS